MAAGEGVPVPFPSVTKAEKRVKRRFGHPDFAGGEEKPLAAVDGASRREADGGAPRFVALARGEVDDVRKGGVG